jgi:LysR family transcriptional activator of nhaA
MGTPAVAAAHTAGFPRSLDGAPMLLPTDDTAIRRSLDQWFASRDLRPVVIGEFEDLSLMRVFGQAGTGAFPVPAVVEKQFKKQYGLQRIGRAHEVRNRFYALSLERQVKHPAVAAICAVARRRLVQPAGARRTRRTGPSPSRRGIGAPRP